MHVMRRVRSIREPRGPMSAKPREPFVARLLADPKLLAELRDDFSGAGGAFARTHLAVT